MPYNGTTIKLTFGGSLPGGEIWQCGLHLDADPLVPSQAALQAFVDSCVAPLTTFWASAGIVAIRSAGVTLNKLTGYEIPGGTDTAALVAQGTIALAANAVQAGCPNPVSLVASLRTIDPGRRGRARIYLPMTGTFALAGGQISNSIASGVATSVANLVTALNGLAAGAVLGGTSGFPVTSVRVDTVPDTQRRRSNKLVPTSVASVAV